MSNRATFKALLLALTISLLVVFGTPLPISDIQALDTHALTHPLQARAANCDIGYGWGLQAGDCALALEYMGRMPHTITDPATGWTVPNKAIFSRAALDGNFRMPQRFMFGTCAILVDLADPSKTIVSNWAFAAAGAHQIVLQCSLTLGLGGFERLYGFDTLVLNPMDMNVRTATMWDQCSNVIDNFHAMAHTPAQCFPPDLQDPAASTGAGVRLSPTASVGSSSNTGSTE